MSLQPKDCIMVDIDGNAVPCVVLAVEYSDESHTECTSIQLQDTGSGRHFWRSYDSLRDSKRFNGQFVSYVAYGDWLLSNKPDITVRFLPSVGERKPKIQKEPKAPKAQFSDEEISILARLLQQKGILNVSQPSTPIQRAEIIEAGDSEA